MRHVTFSGVGRSAIIIEDELGNLSYEYQYYDKAVRFSVKDDKGNAAVVHIEKRDNNCWTATAGKYDRHHDFPESWRPWTEVIPDGMKLNMYLPASAQVEQLSERDWLT